mmetsp:Transcript_32262/g.51985  ORF Transcript_32262/g.51985 Transcript_32262/m.51985 type:complete len:85 (-) Transcript_32262:750-1004(-)
MYTSSISWYPRVTPQLQNVLWPINMPGIPTTQAPAEENPILLSVQCIFIGYQKEGILTLRWGSEARIGIDEADILPEMQNTLEP